MVGGWEVAISHIGANDPREDRSGIHQAGSGSLFAVIDGHGGFECADFVSKMLLPSAAVLGDPYGASSTTTALPLP